jgi:hypothetical protein
MSGLKFTGKERSALAQSRLRSILFHSLGDERENQINLLGYSRFSRCAHL